MQRRCTGCVMNQNLTCYWEGQKPTTKLKISCGYSQRIILGIYCRMSIGTETGMSKYQIQKIILGTLIINVNNGFL